MDIKDITVRNQAPNPSATPAFPRPREGVEPPPVVLTALQERAIDLLTRGEPVGMVAEAVGVDRSTIWRWRTTDPNFIVALNRWRGAIQAETRDRVLAVASEAATTLRQSVADGDGRLGLQLLDKMNCLRPGPDAPIDPFAVYGISLQDEASRQPVFDGFRRASLSMTVQQRLRAPQLLALAVAIENRRDGRENPPDLLDMIGASPQVDLAGTNVGSIEMPPLQNGSRASSDKGTASSGDAGAPPTLKVKAYAIRHGAGNRGGQFRRGSGGPID